MHKNLQEDERVRPVSTEACVHQTTTTEKEEWQIAEWENLGLACTCLGPLPTATNDAFIIKGMAVNHSNSGEGVLTVPVQKEHLEMTSEC